jgi:hypothetical protein
VGWTDFPSATMNHAEAWVILPFRRLSHRPHIACCSSMIRR